MYLRRSRPVHVRWLEPALLGATVVFAAGVLWLNLRPDAPQVNESARVIATDLIFARSEAVRLGREVTLSFSPNAYELSYLDDAQAPVVLRRRAFDEAFPLVRVAAALSDDASRITFGAGGLPKGAQQGVIAVRSAEDAAFARCVELTSDGGVSFEASCTPQPALLLALEQPGE